MRKGIITWPLLMVLTLLTAQTLYAQGNPQQTVADQDLQLLRKDLRSMKKQLIAAATKNYDAHYAIIKDYAANLRNLTDSQAEGLARRWTGVDEEMVKLRQKYHPLFVKVSEARTRCAGSISGCHDSAHTCQN